MLVEDLSSRLAQHIGSLEKKIKFGVKFGVILLSSSEPLCKCAEYIR